MARTINEIQQTLLAAKTASEELSALEVLTTQEQSITAVTSTSKVALWRLLIWIVAFATYLLERLFDQHVAEVNQLITEHKPGRLPWYRTMALRFQFGFELLHGSDVFDNGTATAEQIANSKVVKYAAVSEGAERGLVVLKIAGESNGILQPVTPEQQEAFQSYMSRIKYAGTKIQTRNYLPDLLTLTITIYCDPLVLNANGVHNITGVAVVEQAITNYLKQLPFDGELVLAHLVDALQQVDGVLIPHLTNATSAAVNPTTGDYEDAQVINVKKIPESGYFTLENFNGINYTV